MQKILRRRTLRELRDSWLRYLILGMLITVAVFMIVSLLGAAETVIRGVREHDGLSRMEDGQFRTFSVLSGEQEETIRDRGVILERQFYMDFELPDGSCLRIFRNREEIDLLELLDGEEAREKNEIVLERRYCEVHDLTVGDEVTFAGHLFRITGIGTVPDYNSPMKGMTDSIVDSKQFGPGFVSGDCYEELRAGGNAAQAETYVYSFRLPEGMEGKELRKLIESFPFRVRDIKDPYFQQYYREQTESVSLLLDLVDSFLFDEEDAEDFRRAMEPEIHNLQQFVMAEDNLRIDAAQDDVMINLYGSLLAGVIILALFAYVMTVFILHGIDEDSAVIGALYAMGVKRQELMHHYILLPTIVSFFSGIAGTVLGHTAAGIRYQMMDTYLYYSVPDLPVRPIPYIIVYGVVLPPLIAALVSCLSIRSRLKRSALSLLRKEKKQVRVSNIGFERSPFTARFSMKQTMREIRSVLTVVAGLFICLVLVWIGIDCWVMCGHIRVDNEADTKYEYMYLYKYPEKTAPEGGSAGYAEGFSKERFGYDLDVTLLGMPEDNPYFEVTTGDAQNAVSVSSAMAQKYALSEGDVFTVEDKASERLYAFRVQSVFQYSPGFYAVMEIGAMRDLMGQPDDYYNVVFSDRNLIFREGDCTAL